MVQFEDKRWTLKWNKKQIELRYYPSYFGSLEVTFVLMLVITKFFPIAPMLLKANVLCIYEIVIVYEGLVLKCDDIITRLSKL
jgi:hypothetical protein